MLSNFKFINTQNVGKSNLQTYTNASLGVSFQYPANWVTIPFPPDTNVDTTTSFYGHGITQLSYDPSLILIQMTYTNNPKKLSLTAFNQQYYNTNVPHNGLVWENLATAQPITVGGIQAYFLAHDSCDPYFCNRYLITVNNKILDIHQLLGRNTMNGLSDTEVTKIFNQILSSMKFQ